MENLTRKPSIFIASTVESLDIADECNVNLDHQAEVTVWKHGFDLSQSTIDSLVKKAESVDFAIFIFTPDDVTTIRDQQKNTVRDNIVFELGLFVGTLGNDYLLKNEKPFSEAIEKFNSQPNPSSFGNNSF